MVIPSVYWHTYTFQTVSQRVAIAIDFHDEPFYGKDLENRTYVCRAKAQAGTTRFWRVATAYAMQKGQRVTLAMCYVLPEHIHYRTQFRMAVARQRRL